MKTCTRCGKELPTSLDEYGDLRAVVCRDCFLTQEEIPTDDEKKIKERLDELEALIEEADIWADDDAYIDGLNREFREAMLKIVKDAAKAREKQRVTDWAHGLPKYAKDTPDAPNRTSLLQFNQ